MATNKKKSATMWRGTRVVKVVKVSCPQAGNSNSKTGESQLSFPQAGNSSSESQVRFPLADNSSYKSGESQVSSPLAGNSTDKVY